MDIGRAERDGRTGDRVMDRLGRVGFDDRFGFVAFGSS